MPAQLALRINPEVWMARAAKVEAQLQDEVSARVRRRRCAEITTDFLLKTLDK
jgi:hypothetical protein